MGGRRGSRRRRKDNDSQGRGRSGSRPADRDAARRRSAGRDDLPSAQPGVPKAGHFLGFCGLLLLAVLLAYQPAWRGGLIWDDDKHITRLEMQSWEGLRRIWFDLGATQQYYPLLHSAFWLEHRLWGDSTLGYHLANIMLHAAAAMLAGLILHRLAVPGAYLAAALFALHPVQVESVAWITEQKNTLSAVFYLGAALAYLRFDQTRKRTLYVAALALFILSLLSKTVTVTLPAALLLVFWWQRGRLSWQRDVLPLTPFFLIGVVAGSLIAWVERTLIGAEGPAFDLTLVERVLLAGRAFWFYLGKLFWPADLLFMYPHWQIGQGAWGQYVWPAAALILVASLWTLRRRWRGPLAATLFFIGTLLPVLGLFNAYLFLYTYVADHFQYLASLGILALVSAGIALLLGRWGLWGRPAGYALCLGLLAALACLTFRQSRMYTDIESLYQTTIDRNPACWLAHDNLGIILLARGEIAEARAHFLRALEIKPDNVEVANNLAWVLATCPVASLRNSAEAVEIARRANRLSGGNRASVLDTLAAAYAEAGRFAEAVQTARKALELAVQQNNQPLVDALPARIALYEAGKPFRQTTSASGDTSNPK
jgi:protein O-mannosyl-transferase